MEKIRAFASETNDLDPNQIDYIDYINDGGYNEYYRWTNWKREPDQTEVFAGLIFKKNGQVTERLVNKVAVTSLQIRKQACQRKRFLNAILVQTLMSQMITAI